MTVRATAGRSPSGSWNSGMYLIQTPPGVRLGFLGWMRSRREVTGAAVETGEKSLGLSHLKLVDLA